MNNPLSYNDPSGNSLVVAGMMLWFFSMPMRDYAINHNNKTLYHLSSAMQIGGSIMMGGGIENVGLLGSMVWNGAINSMNSSYMNGNPVAGFI